MYVKLFLRLILALLILTGLPLFAIGQTTNPTAVKAEDLTLYFLISLTILILFISVFVLIVGIQVIVLLFNQNAKNPAEEQTFWQTIWGLKPLSKEKDLLLHEDYDGIQELDNPTPVWFNVLFLSTIAIAIAYMLVYHVWNIGDLQEVEYEKEIAYAEVQKEEYLKKVASGIDETTVKFANDANSLENGKRIFIQNCAICHGENGEGKLGPNLTDKFWIYGGKIGIIFKTIKYGAKNGMISWSKKLNPLMMQEVSSYIVSLKNSNPANPKEPQGKEDDDEDDTNDEDDKKEVSVK